jgi:hypothetical protein
MERPKPTTLLSFGDYAVQIHAHEKVVDRHLSRPAVWRGSLRRDFRSKGIVGEQERYAATFNNLGELATTEPNIEINVPLLCQLHDEAVGGQEFRSRGLRIGSHHEFPPPSKLDRLLVDLFERIRQNSEPPPLSAARLHLELLLIHPFRDGNGRTSRLLSSFILMRAGYRSTLFTAVEQHFRLCPRDYIKTLDRFRLKEISIRNCLSVFLQAMVCSSHLVAWFRTREGRLRRRCREAGLSRAQIETELIRFDFGPSPSNCVLTSCEEPRWQDIRQQMERNDLILLSYQLTRLRLEERSESQTGGTT